MHMCPHVCTLLQMCRGLIQAFHVAELVLYPTPTFCSDPTGSAQFYHIWIALVLASLRVPTAILATCAQGMSPLVIMTSAREYTIAPHSDAQLQRAALPGAEEGPPEAVSGFKAAYGSLSDQAARQAAQRVQEAVGPQSVFARQGEKNRPPWAELFDAPSHVLPPLSTLLPSFLDLMVPREAPLAD